MSEDLKPSGDITTELIKDNKKINAKIISNQNCVVGGLVFAKEAFKYSDKKVSFKTKTKDGKKIKKGKKNANKSSVCVSVFSKKTILPVSNKKHTTFFFCSEKKHFFG